jgi:hypothetical protein
MHWNVSLPFADYLWYHCTIFILEMDAVVDLLLVVFTPRTLRLSPRDLVPSQLRYGCHPYQAHISSENPMEEV